MTLTGTKAQASEVYGHLIAELREVLTAAEIAAACGVTERQVHHWRAGETRPRGKARERLLDLHYLLEGLRDVYTREGIEVFWHGRNRDVDGQRPIDLAQAGNFEPLVELVGRLRDSNF